MNEQIKNKFDRITLIKIGKGALIAGCGTVGLYILGWLGTVNYGSQWTPIITALIPILVNAIREYMKGIEIEK